MMIRNCTNCKYADVLSSQEPCNTCIKTKDRLYFKPSKNANIMICDEVIAWKHPFDIKKVIFNDPATIVLWADGTKTIVKAVDEEFDPEKGLAMAITKKALGNKGSYFDEIKKWTEPYYEKEAKEEAEKKPEFSLLDFLINPEKGFTMTFEADGKEITLNDVVMLKKGTE